MYLIGSHSGEVTNNCILHSSFLDTANVEWRAIAETVTVVVLAPLMIYSYDLFWQLNCCQNQNSTDPCCGTNVLPAPVTSPNSTSSPLQCRCASCWSIIEPQMHQAVKFVGGLGLFFSFTEVSRHTHLQNISHLFFCIALPIVFACPVLMSAFQNTLVVLM